jgi:hypothetical protein
MLATTLHRLAAPAKIIPTLQVYAAHPGKVKFLLADINLWLKKMRPVLTWGRIMPPAANWSTRGLICQPIIPLFCDSNTVGG